MSSISWKPIGSAMDLRLDQLDRRPLVMSIGVLLAFWTLVLLVERYDAPIVLVSGVLLVGAVPLLRRPERATLLTAFLLYINFPAILTKQHGVPSIVAGAFILLLAVPLIRHLVIRREPIRADATFGMMVALLAAYLLSSFEAIDQSIANERILTYVLEGMLVYLLVLNVVRTRRTLRQVVWTLLVAGGLLGSLSLYQQVTGSYRQEFGGLAYRNYTQAEDDPDRAGPPKREIWDRAQGPLNEPNRFAQVLIVLLPLAVVTFRNEERWGLRLWALGLGAMTFAGIVLTLSRGAYVAIVLMAITMMALGWIRVSRLLLTGIACAIVASTALAPTMPFLVKRIDSITSLGGLLVGDADRVVEEADGAVQGRMTLMLAATHVFLDHPLVGVGPGQFPPFYSMDYAEKAGMDFGNLRQGNWRAHSLYLEIAAETGLIGLMVFLAIVGRLAWRLWRARVDWMRLDPEYSDLATALCLSLLAYLWTGIFLHLSYERYFWFLLALASAALHVLYTRYPRAAVRDLGAPAHTPQTRKSRWHPSH